MFPIWETSDTRSRSYFLFGLTHWQVRQSCVETERPPMVLKTIRILLIFNIWVVLRIESSQHVSATSIVNAPAIECFSCQLRGSRSLIIIHTSVELFRTLSYLRTLVVWRAVELPCALKAFTTKLITLVWTTDKSLGLEYRYCAFVKEFRYQFRLGNRCCWVLINFHMVLLFFS
jgi:hypothetical protein